MALLGGVAALVVARQTARSVTQPIARLAADATRLGDGDFAPIAPVGGPREIDDLRRDLERMREKLLGVDRLKAAFLASVSHELRSPLGRLREALALLADGTVGALTKQQERVVTLARRACEQEVRIVEQLLDMTRVSSGGTVHFEAGADLAKVIVSALDAERPAATERGVELVFEPATTATPHLRLDTALVERAIANLVRNGASVTPRDGKVRVVLGVVAGGVRIDVVDDGPGLAPGLRVFEPFSAAGVEAAGRPAGIGLGLSLAREVARAHGGDLEVVTGAPKTTFRLELPVERNKE
jgi:two-component system sensor histidine kinase GlrK